MDKQVFVLTSTQVRRNAANACMNAPDGQRVQIAERTRTTSQSDLMWSCLTDIARQVSWPVNGKLEKLGKEDWKDLMTASFTQENRIAQGVRGGFVMLGKSTSKMTVRQMTALIDFIHAFGAEHDVQWSETSIGREFA